MDIALLIIALIALGWAIKADRGNKKTRIEAGFDPQTPESGKRKRESVNPRIKGGRG